MLAIRKIGLAVATALVLLSACNNGSRVKKPSVLLSEQQMIDVLSDAYLIEAELNQRKSMGKEVAKLEETYYDQVFEHYGITDSIFDENMAYYSTQLAALERIMDSVNQRFVKAQARQ